MIVRLRVEPPGADPFVHDLQSGEVIIGRASTAGVVINDSSVSRQHARFVFREETWWIEDLGATNRTQLNGSTIQGATAIRPGDRLKMGGTFLHVLADSPTGPVANEAELVSNVYDAGSRQAERLRTLNEIHRALATALSLPELLQLILDRSFDVLRPEEGVILLRTPAGAFEQAASRRLPSVKTPMVVSRRLIDEVAGKSKPALVLDAAIDERFAGSDSIMASGIRSVLAAPLVDAAGILGLIALCSRASVRRFSENDLDLLVSLASAAALRVRNVELAEEAAARKVFEHELAIAHDLQMSMLPRDLPARPEVALAARLQPARSIGGDLYDFVEDECRLWFIIADVAGKSVAAALYMAVAKTLFRATHRRQRQRRRRRLADESRAQPRQRADDVRHGHRRLPRSVLGQGRARRCRPQPGRAHLTGGRDHGARPYQVPRARRGRGLSVRGESRRARARDDAGVVYGWRDGRAERQRRAIRQRSPRPRIRVSRQDGARRDREPRGGRGRTIRGGRAAGRRFDAACPAVQGQAGINLELGTQN